MTKTLKPVLHQLLEMGIRPDTPVIEAQKTYMFNLFLLVATPFALLSFVINIFSHNYLPAVLNIVQLSIFATSYRIAYTRKNLHFRTSLLMALALIAIVSAYYYKNGSEYRLLIMIVAAVVFFDKNWQYLFFATMVAIVFVLIRLDDMFPENMSNSEMTGNILKILLPIFLFVTCLFYFKHIYFKNLIQLEMTNKELSLAKEQKERILNAVAHDLRSPISNIAGISKMMLLDDHFSQDQKQLLKLIERSSDTSLILINDLLQNSNAIIESAILQQVDLNELMSRFLPALQFRANEKNISIQTELLSLPLMVAVDSDRIERVITNLVNNAIKFSPEKSVITIGVCREASHALLMVKDQGIGIPKKNHELIFDMFTNAKRKGTAGEKSFGMGLSICKQIVEQHEGSISLEGEPGTGSSFYVRLPLDYRFPV